MTIKLIFQKYDYITKLSTIEMNFSSVTTTSHYSHLDYEFKILSIYVIICTLLKIKKLFF
jgi:hypothetical protein